MSGGMFAWHDLPGDPPEPDTLVVAQRTAEGFQYELPAYRSADGQWRSEDGLPIVNAPTKWRQFQWRTT